jgi:hypothetical protein
VSSLASHHADRAHKQFFLKGANFLNMMLIIEGIRKTVSSLYGTYSTAPKLIFTQETLSQYMNKEGKEWKRGGSHCTEVTT